MAAAVRLLAAVLPLSTALPPDPRLADAAENLARGAGIAAGMGVVTTPTASVPPAPVVLLAAWIGLLGGRGGTDVWLAVAIGALLPLVVGQLAATLYGPTVGRLAAWISALDPLLLGGVGLLQEQAFAFALTAALVLTANWLRTPRMGRAVGSGAAWGTCALCWTPGLGLMVAAVGWAWSPLGLVAGARDRLRHLSALALGAACVLVPWVARNAFVLHAVAPVTTSSGTAFLSGNNRDVWGSPRRRGGRIDVLAVEPYASRLSAAEATRDARAWRDGFAFLKTVRARDAVVTARHRLARLWSPGLHPDDSDPTSAPSTPVTPAIAIVAAVLSLLGAWGMVRALSGARRWFQSLPALVLVVMSLGTLAFYGSSRTRIAIEPLVALLAALGVQDARRRFHLQRTGLRLVTRRTSGQRV